jgi:glyoxylase-like metal-dependent hydrolase (beta-lactamase superfamily II)
MSLRREEIGGEAVLFRGDTYDSGCLALFDRDRALLVDGLGSVEDARVLRGVLVEEMGKTVALLVSTHFFSDHMAAFNLFPDAPLLAHENALETFWSEQFRSDEEVAHLRPPTMLLGGRLTLTWGRFTVELFENAGHTGGTLNVDVPELDLLHVADTAVGRMAYFQYTTPEALDGALARALERGRRRVLRSHGPLTHGDSLRSARGYLANLGARVLEARRGGLPIDGIGIEECLPAGPPATDFESVFHARNLASIQARGLYREAP